MIDQEPDLLEDAVRIILMVDEIELAAAESGAIAFFEEPAMDCVSHTKPCEADIAALFGEPALLFDIALDEPANEFFLTRVEVKWPCSTTFAWIIGPNPVIDPVDRILFASEKLAINQIGVCGDLDG
jgi:hypothetical protein